MAPIRSTECTVCGHPKSDSGAFRSAGKYSDGTARLSAKCKKCCPPDKATPEQRERSRKYKERKRREAGVPVRMRGRDETCPRGHLKAENTRPGRYDCAACHRERERERQHARGVKPRVKTSTFPCGHSREGNTRMAKGKPIGCRQCHRENERARPYNPETARRYAQKNRERLNRYRTLWAAANRPRTSDFRSGGKDAMDYARIIINDPCGICGGASTEIDHITPVTKGGTGEWTNLAPMCRACNASKQNKHLLQFLMRRLETQSTRQLTAKGL